MTAVIPPPGAFFPLSPAFFHPALLLDFHRYNNNPTTNTTPTTLQSEQAASGIDASSSPNVLSQLPDTSPEIVDTLDITTKV